MTRQLAVRGSLADRLLAKLAAEVMNETLEAFVWNAIEERIERNADKMEPLYTRINNIARFKTTNNVSNITK